MSAPRPNPQLGRSTGPPFSMVVGLISGALLYAVTQPQIRDVDVYWHIRAGHELLSGVPVSALGSSWSYAPSPLPWVITQWLAEVVIHLIHGTASWPGLVAYRATTAGVAVALLGYSTLRGRPAVLASFPYLVAVTAVIGASQERPGQATMIGAAALGSVLVSGLTQASLPRWWILLPMTIVWANSHGGWVLVPVTLALIAFARVLDHGVRDNIAREALGLGLLTVVAGTITPAGPASTFAALRFANSTEEIIEWMPTVPFQGVGRLAVAMMALVALGWARSEVPRSEAAITVLLFLFAMSAFRNVTPALLMLSPLVANRLGAAFPTVGRDPEPRWSAPLGLLAACVLLVAGLATIPGRNALPVEEYPVLLAERIANLPGQQRVLNDYNVAGLVLFFAGTDDQVGIDGRSDRYGAEYIQSYVGLKDLEGDWESLLDELDPTSALVERDTALAHVLVTERAWVAIAEEGDWVLLLAPTEG